MLSLSTPFRILLSFCSGLGVTLVAFIIAALGSVSGNVFVAKLVHVTFETFPYLALYTLGLGWPLFKLRRKWDGWFVPVYLVVHLLWLKNVTDINALLCGGTIIATSVWYLSYHRNPVRSVREKQ